MGVGLGEGLVALTLGGEVGVGIGLDDEEKGAEELNGLGVDLVDVKDVGAGRVVGYEAGAGVDIDLEAYAGLYRNLRSYSYVRNSLECSTICRYLKVLTLRLLVSFKI